MNIKTLKRKLKNYRGNLDIEYTFTEIKRKLGKHRTNIGKNCKRILCVK